MTVYEFKPLDPTSYPELTKDDREEAARLSALPHCGACEQPIDGESEAAAGLLIGTGACAACERDMLAALAVAPRDWRAEFVVERAPAHMMNAPSKTLWNPAAWASRVKAMLAGPAIDQRRRQGKRALLLEQVRADAAWKEHDARTKREALEAARLRLARDKADHEARGQHIAELEASLGGKPAA